MPRQFLLKMIRFYQRTWSPDHSPRRIYYPQGYCRYYPSCSEYGYQVVEKHGVIKGIAATIWRIIRCNPLSAGGYDPVK